MQRREVLGLEASCFVIVIMRKSMMRTSPSGSAANMDMSSFFLILQIEFRKRFQYFLYTVGQFILKSAIF